MANLVEQIDAALGRYYKLKNIKGYYDDDGNGKFKKYCEDNGTSTLYKQHRYNNQGTQTKKCLGLAEDDEIEGELLEDADQSMLVVCWIAIHVVLALVQIYANIRIGL